MERGKTIRSIVHRILYIDGQLSQYEAVIKQLSDVLIRVHDSSVADRVRDSLREARVVVDKLVIRRNRLVDLHVHMINQQLAEKGFDLEEGKALSHRFSRLKTLRSRDR